MKYINKENLNKAAGLLNNRFFLLAVIVILIMLTLKQCGAADHRDQSRQRVQAQ